METLQIDSYKNITVNYMADKINKDGLYVDEAGNPVELDKCTAKREAISFYNSPKNTNKRKKITLTITVKSLKGGKQSLNKHIGSQNNWVKKEITRIGEAKSMPIYTMLKNKGFRY